MSFIAEYWLPIVVATVLCFIAGSILHMAIPLHRTDWRPLPDEDGVLGALKKAGVTPGNYMFPAMADMSKMKDPVFLQRLRDNPGGVMIVRPPGEFEMGPYLVKQFAYHLVISVFVAYIASRTVAAGTEFLKVFQITGTVSMLAYAAAVFPEAIWYHHPRSYVFAKVVDGIVWGLLTAVAFAWLGPK